LRKDRPTAAASRRLLAGLIAVAVCGWVALRVLGLETDLAEQAYCLACMACAAALLGVASGRAAFGLYAGSLLLGVIWLASALKVSYLHEPLLAPDLRYFGGTFTLAVIGHYPGMLRKSLIAMLGGGTLAVLLWRLESPGLWQARRWRRRLGMSLLATLPLAASLSPHGPFAPLYAAPTWEYISNGARNPISTFIRSFTRMGIELPARSNPVDPSQWRLATPALATAAAPDIVVVLEESTLDPQQWADCTSAHCRSELLQPDATTRALGALRTHTWGGGTWTSEFALLTGLPHNVFGAAGIYAPFNLVPRLADSLPRQLKRLGYHTIAIYPMAGDFVGAAGAYRDYGFDEFHDSTELGLRWGSTDDELFERAQALYAARRAANEGPLFMMILTMRQHGPHDYPLSALPPPWNEPPAPRLDERSNRNLATYLYRLHQSALALAQLRGFLFAGDRHALLMHFGDHHPSFDGLELSLRRRQADGADALYNTYYRIDANFATPAWHAPRVLDLAFLASVALQLAQLPPDRYFQANTRLRERCDGLFEGCPPAVLEPYFGYILDQLHLLQ